MVTTAPATVRGERAFAVPLGRAMDAQASDRDSLTHGFHSYPARMHPAVARILLEQFHVPGGNVLDPFCGSGTVPLEAMCAGLPSLGSDLNPLGLRLARVKCEVRDEAGLRRFGVALSKVAAASRSRVEKRISIHAELPPEHIRWYAPHVLKELAGLLVEIGRVKAPDDRAALEMVFSAIVTKFSNKSADTGHAMVERRHRKGLVTEFFERKGEELIERWRALAAAVPGRPKKPSFLLSDARRLTHTLGGEFHASLVITSPPYGGTYDYAQHHELRMAWLGIGDAALHRDEIGSRRQFSAAHTARGKEEWDTQLRAVLMSLAELTVEEGMVILLVGDADIGEDRVPADRQIERIGSRCGFTLAAVASQERPDWRGGAPRSEHLIALIRERDP